MRLLASIFGASVIVLVGCSVTPPAGQGSYPSSTAAEVTLIDYDGGEHGRGRGNARKNGLPPGTAKNLARGKPLPPGIAKQHVPHHVLVKLPPLEDGYEYIVVAGKILLIEIATQVVHDILVDVLLD